MKTQLLSIFVFFTSLLACQNHNLDSKLTFHYKAQTRGFIHQFQFENDALKFVNNSGNKTLNLSKDQLNKIDTIFADIDFQSLKNNTSTEALAVDKMIAAIFTLNYENEHYEFQFDHNNLPIQIGELLSYVESLFD